MNKLSCSLVGESQTLKIIAGTTAHKAYGRNTSTETFQCNYGLNEVFRAKLEDSGLVISGVDPENTARIIELKNHPFFMATLFLPQLLSTVENPHPLIHAFLGAVLLRANRT